MRKMMICMISLLCLTVALSGCSGKSNNTSTSAASEETQAVTEPSSENWKETEPVTDVERTGVVIKPLPMAVDIANLDECTVAASLEEGDFYLDDDGKAQMKFTVYDYDVYDLVDIANIAAGDVIVLHGDDVVVNSVERPGGIAHPRFGAA